MFENKKKQNKTNNGKKTHTKKKQKGKTTLRSPSLFPALFFFPCFTESHGKKIPGCWGLILYWEYAIFRNEKKKNGGKQRKSALNSRLSTTLFYLLFFLLSSMIEDVSRWVCGWQFLLYYAVLRCTHAYAKDSLFAVRFERRWYRKMKKKKEFIQKGL